MTPTLRDGQFVLSEPLERKPKVGDIVLVDVDGATLVKRVAMVAGDKYTEAYVSFAHTWTMVRTAAQRRMVSKGLMQSRIRTIPEGQMYILGDNLDVSVDSRTFGLVPTESIRGIIDPLM
jgi:signal peptidase I